MSRIRNIVFLVESPFNKRDYDRYGLEILQHNGFEVEVWDCTPFLRPQVYKKVTVPDPVDLKMIYRFVSNNEAIDALRALSSDTVVISLVVYDLRSHGLYRALSGSRSSYCILVGSLMPLPLAHNVRFHIGDKLRSITAAKVVNKILWGIPFRYLKLRYASFAFVIGGMCGIEQYRMIGNTTEIIPAHSFDYDIYLRHKNGGPSKNDDIAVFLDEYLPFHPDYEYLNMKPFTTAEEYYPALRDYFDYLESTHGIEIVIAAHPRSHYDRHPDYFGGRRIVRNRTAKLVRESKLVILHFSTAVNFAVLFRKPLVFLTSNALDKLCHVHSIYTMASSLGRTPINMNKNDEYKCENTFDVDTRLYSKYKNQYIKTEGSMEDSSWQIFADHIKGFNKAEA